MCKLMPGGLEEREGTPILVSPELDDVWTRNYATCGHHVWGASGGGGGVIGEIETRLRGSLPQLGQEAAQ